MTEDIELRIKIEAAFPGAEVAPEPAGGWRIALAEPLSVDDLEVWIICLRQDGWLVLVRSIKGVEAWGAPTGTWIAVCDEVRRRLASVSGHQTFEARHRLGL